MLNGCKECHGNHKRIELGGKQCPKCKLWKDVDEFHTNRFNKDGLYNCCKECISKRKRYERTMLGVKKCYRCKIEKDVSKFYTDKINQDGLHSYCKECKNNRRRVIL